MSKIEDTQVGHVTLLDKVTNTNEYRSRHWNLEEAVRYIFALPEGILEASFFAHYHNDTHVKNVIELPLSYGCPVGCRHCASAELSNRRQLSVESVLNMVDFIIDDHGVEDAEQILVTFSGIGEGVFQRRSLPEMCRKIQSRLPGAYFTLTTVGFDPSFLRDVERLSEEVVLHYLQVSYLHHRLDRLCEIIPNADRLGFDFRALVSEIRKSRGVTVRFNYVVIRGLNEDDETVKELIGLVAGLEADIVFRVSALNETTPSRQHGLERTDVRVVEAIVEQLRESGFTAYPFFTEVDDQLNCGQLTWDYSLSETAHDA